MSKYIPWSACGALLLLSVFLMMVDARADMPLQGYGAIDDFNAGGFVVPGQRVMEQHAPFTPCQIKEVWKGTAKPLGYFEQVLGSPGARLNSGTWNSGTDVIDIYVWGDVQANLIVLKFNRGMMAEALVSRHYEECAR